MSASCCRRVLGSWVGFLVLTGLWLGHTLEDVRVSGSARLLQELTEPTFMLPLGITVAIFAAVASARLWRLWLRLSGRLDTARNRIRALWRNQACGAADELPLSRVPSFAGGVASLWAPLSLLQIGLYLTQENLEALVEGARLPGAAPLTGAHWAAAPIYAAVALLLAATATFLARRLRERHDQVARLEALATHFANRVGREIPALPRGPLTALPPLRLFGASLWRRPPPLVPS